ncbi:MAG: permease-like cell division protein FtsX [Patescibacteria group bacterium]|nr:permease-like cell division protein FtsX [Patescibacteria group bacterium]
MQIILRILKTSWQGLFRNGWLSLVAIFIITQVLLLVGLFVSLNIGINYAISEIADRIDVAIFFEDYATENNILAFQDKIKTTSGVKELKYISSGEAKERYLENSQYNQQLLNLVGEDESFFPASIEVRVTNPELIEQVVGKIKESDDSRLISATSLEKNQTIIERLRKFNRLLAYGNLILSVILLIIALMIIFNTIRMTIFTRKEEIEIMKLVGATDWYIRWPFIIEGIFYGIIGAIVAFLLTIGLFRLGIWLLGAEYWTWQTLSLENGMFNWQLFVQIFVIQFIFGILVGAISSYFSTRRYLRI